MQPTRSILLAEEDAATRAFLTDNLTADGYEVLGADSKAAAVAKLEARQPDIVICDVNGDTLDLLDAVRRSDGLASRIDPDVPLIVLTARADELSRVRYFDRGSDDVVAKPFSYPELRGRVAALLRRSQPRHGTRITQVGTLRIHHPSRQVHVGDTRVDLSAKEFALLAHLAADPMRVFTKNELLRDIWGFRLPARTRTVDSHACRLRRKLAEAADGRFVQCVWGVGYRLVAPSEALDAEEHTV
jgi:DNA-binding response OmpR family regulator